MQADLIKNIRQNREGLVLAGDARCDSMGHRYAVLIFFPLWGVSRDNYLSQYPLRNKSE